MVVGKPYIHFTINNEASEEEIDYNYTWATTVETDRGPVNTPVLVSNAQQAEAIFNVDMRPYFSQGAQSLIIVRVAARSDTKQPSKGIYSFVTQEDIKIYRAEQATITTQKTINIGTQSEPEYKKIDYTHKLYYATEVNIGTYEFTSYSDAEGTTQWGKGTVDVISSVTNGYTEVEVKTNSTDSTFIGRRFYITSNAKTDGTKYELFTDAGMTGTGIFVEVKAVNSSAITNYIPLIEYRKTDGTLVPEAYIDTWNANGTIITQEDVSAAGLLNEATENNIASEGYDPENYKRILTASKIYPSNQVKPFLTPTEYIIPAGTPLFSVTSAYEGDYGIVISTTKSVVGEGYTIVLTDPALGTIRINNGYDVTKIVNRINDKGFNFEAKATNSGLAIAEAMHSNPKPVDTYSFASASGYSPLIINDFQPNAFISLAQNKESKEIGILTKIDATIIENDIKNGTKNAEVDAIDYSINLVEAGNKYLVGSSNGEWDTDANRVTREYQAMAHREGLELLQRLRVAGVFCMYGEADIQREYVEHGINSIEPEKGMNNNQTCKWRTIILGASENDRDSKTSLAAKAAALDNSYILLLGHGLIDTGVSGIAAKMTSAQKSANHIIDDHQLLPYECTQYIAGLRSKLEYHESIFGGQGRKRIRGVGALEIAPLFDYDDSFVWDPNAQTYLNEAGVLTFTEDYGNITLVDGVTTVQKGSEEDEEGVMNIVKYALNAIHDVCLPYIGRNINSDLEQSITMDIEGILNEMAYTDLSLVDTDEYKAYEFEVNLGARRDQRLGRIYIPLKITPAHALRQIEAEMTVQ